MTGLGRHKQVPVRKFVRFWRLTATVMVERQTGIQAERASQCDEEFGVLLARKAGFGIARVLPRRLRPGRDSR